MLNGLAIVCAAQFTKAQVATNVAGVIGSNTTWAKSNSPYNFVGPVGVPSGVTLTIQAGVTVNMNNYYLQVNGTLNAIGTGAEPIYLNGDIALFGSTSSNGIIQNTVMYAPGSPALSLTNSSASILNDKITAGGRASQFGAYIVVNSGSPAISNNLIYGSLNVNGGAAKILHNIVYCPFTGAPAISASGTATISDNTVTGVGRGEGVYINAYSGNPTITENIISNFSTGIRAYYSGTIEKNLIVNNEIGIDVGLGTNLIEYNTIGYNSIGINSPKNLSTVTYNNIENNSENSIHLDAYSENNVTCANNWWGTTNIAQINQTLNYEYNGFNIIEVNFLPILTSPDAQAPAITTPIPTAAPILTPTQTSSTSQAPSQSPLGSFGPQLFGSKITEIVVVVVVIAIVVVAIVAFMLGKRVGRNRVPAKPTTG
jgi:hypothetical protein